MLGCNFWWLVAMLPASLITVFISICNPSKDFSFKLILFQFISFSKSIEFKRMLTVWRNIVHYARKRRKKSEIGSKKIVHWLKHLLLLKSSLACEILLMLFWHLMKIKLNLWELRNWIEKLLFMLQLITASKTMFFWGEKVELEISNLKFLYRLWFPFIFKLKEGNPKEKLFLLCLTFSFTFVVSQPKTFLT